MFKPRYQIFLSLNNDGVFMTEVDPYYKIGFIYCENEYCKKIAEQSKKAYLKKNDIIEIKSLFPNKNGIKQILPIIVPRSKLNKDGIPITEQWYIDTNVNIIKIDNEYSIMCVSSLYEPYVYKYINITKLNKYNEENKHLQVINDFINTKNKKNLPTN